MKKMIFYLLFFFTSLSLFSQDNIPQEIPFIQLNGNLQVGIPLEDFGENIGETGFGFGGLALIRVGSFPFFGGLDISGVSYDREATEFSLVVDGFLTDVELKTQNNILFMHGMLRIQPDVDFFISPYFDGLVGTKVLYTRTTLKDLLVDEDRLIESETDQIDWAFSYGGAVGLQIELSRNTNIMLDLRCTYLPGASAEYLVRREDLGATPINDPIDVFEEKRSPTDVLIPQIGVTFKFEKFNN